MKTYTVEVEVTNLMSKKRSAALAEEFYNYMLNKYDCKFGGGSISIKNVTTRVVEGISGHIPYFSE